MNDIRTKGTSSVWYKGFKASCDEVATNGSWTITDKTAKITTTKETAAAALAYVNALTAATTPTTPLSWSAGLAAAGQKLYDNWDKTGTTGVTDGSNQSSVARASNYGSLGNSPLVEAVTYATVNFFSTQDALTALLIGEGDSTGSTRVNLFDSKNTVASCFNGFKADGTTNYFTEVQFARTFTNKADINT